MSSPSPTLALALALGLTSACTTEFPSPAAEADAQQLEVDGGGPARADAGGPLDAQAQRLDAGPVGTRDAAPTIPRDAAGDVDRIPDARPPGSTDGAAPGDAAPPLPPSVELTANPSSPIRGCASRFVTLSWRTAAVTHCELTANPPGPRLAIDADRLPLGDLSTPVGEDARFSIDCEGPGGRAHAQVDVTFSPALSPTLSFDRSEQVRAEQRACAQALGDQAVSVGGEEHHAGHVHHDDASALRVCQCAGYARVTRSDGHRPCFASPGDNTLGFWDVDHWDLRRAAPDNICVEHLDCADPFATCAELLYPR